MLKHGLLIHEDIVEIVKDWSPAKLDKFLGVAFRECFDLPGPRTTSETGILRLLKDKATKADNRREKLLKYDRERKAKDNNGVGGTPTESVIDKNRIDKIPPLSPEGASSSAGRFMAPISREQCVNLAADPIMSVQVPAEFAAAWWDEHEHDGWTDDEGRAIKGMRRVRQLLAGAFKYEKNKSARAADPVGGSARVFDPEVCE